MRRSRLAEAILIALAALFTVASIAPLVWTLLGSFQTVGELIATPPIWLPDFRNLGNYARVLSED